MDLKLSGKPVTVDTQIALDFLQEQLKTWATKISEAIEETNVLETLVNMIRIDGKSLGEIFGQKKVDCFLAVAELLLKIKSKEHLISVLNDLISILCLMACIVGNVLHLQLASAAADGVKLYRSIKAHAAGNERLYKKLFEALKLLTPTEGILKAATCICSLIMQNSTSLAAYITYNCMWTTLTTTTGCLILFAGYFGSLLAAFGAVFAIGFALGKSSNDKKRN
ncbi:hypothetical protein EB796_024457 [Bugula neritina]|uniref:Uncharacterized protein n=1 Tax=Bugula neritina TaxID=10212 RepID=A0A7J7IUL9_BUGNE|nr:hypothetical protein EB796_024457 [Bugula neritina]